MEFSSDEPTVAQRHELQFTITPRNGALIGSYNDNTAHSIRDETVARKFASIVRKAITQPGIDLAQIIADAIQTNDNARAIEAILHAKRAGTFALPLNNDLLMALISVKTDGLDRESCRLVRYCRFVTAYKLRRLDVAAPDASELLAEHSATFDENEMASFEMIVAIASIQSGQAEAGLLTLRELAKNSSANDAETRGWIWRNLSIFLPMHDAETRLCAEYSSDAFLEAGDAVEAARSLVRLIKCLEFTEPSVAAMTFERIVGMVRGRQINDRAFLAMVLHRYADWLSKSHRPADALSRAEEAIALSRGLVGRESQHVASLNLAAYEAKQLNLDKKAAEFEEEANRIAGEIPEPRFRLTRRLNCLFTSYDAGRCQALQSDAEQSNDIELLAAIAVARAIHDSSLTAASRLALLESSLSSLEKKDLDETFGPPIRFEIGRQLDRLGSLERAEVWYRKAHENDPFDMAYRDALVSNLWRQKKWADAATMLNKQISLQGKMPGLLYAYGRSLLEAGDRGEAVMALTSAYALIGDHNPLKKVVLELRERALRAGEELDLRLLAARSVTAPQVVTRDEFAVVIREFGEFVSSQKRMGFWKFENGRHHWRERPEQRGQDLLHTFLKACFRDRIEVFEEVSAGAGRIDILVKLSGGLTCIVELKMCGAGYSSAYAAAGEDQILHYMANRGTNLGFLVVFDARIREQGRALLATSDPTITIEEILVDVRPLVINRLNRAAK